MKDNYKIYLIKTYGLYHLVKYYLTRCYSCITSITKIYNKKIQLIHKKVLDIDISCFTPMSFLYIIVKALFQTKISSKIFL